MVHVAVEPDAFTDAEMVQLSRTDTAAFAALYDRHAGGLYRYASQRVGPQTAEDAVADTFLAAFQQRDGYDLDRPDARPWLFGILTRKLARHHRTEQARYRAIARAQADPGAGADEDGPADRVAARVTAGAVRAPLAQALRRLPAGDRDVLLLVAWCDFTYEEVAAALGIPVGTVRSRLNRARRKVRDALGGTDPTREV
ncbi:RNA polymerase sigma factor [Dactylosporangium sp. NPDC049525]|uniref:RNA polymerase sigma factor n=1 Tax=Dactylosporangium sp. NPDC049525 TaxID=3154730 RepID=UPI003442BBAF